MEKQIQAWEHELISSRGAVAQNLKVKLKEAQERLDRLVSLYLDGDIERESYLIKKDALLRQRAKLEEDLGDCGRQGKNRLEPLRSFVLSLREAKNLVQTKNHALWRDFFRKIGSNPTLKDKTLSLNWGELWDFAAKTNAENHQRSAIFALQKSHNQIFSEKVSSGALFLK